MDSHLRKPLTIGISSTALFDMREEHRIFEEDGIASYRKYQFEKRREILEPGTAFYLVKKLLTLNTNDDAPRIDIALISKNDIETGLRVRHSLDNYGLDVPRIALTGGQPIQPHLLRAYGIDLFLSKDHEDVQRTVDADIAAAVLHDPPEGLGEGGEKIHFAFDGDQVIFSGESENIFQKEGLMGFLKYEQDMADIPMPEGPFAKVLFVIEALKTTFPKGESPIETSLVTMRSATAQVRPMNTLIEWGQIVDGAYMIGRSHPKGQKYEKVDVLQAIKADIFFDDQTHHTELAASSIPSGYVPTKTAV